VVGQEKRAREMLLKRNGTQLKDQMGRAYGTLVNAYLMSSEEAISLLSKLRLGVSLHLSPHLSIQALNELFFMITPAQLQVKEGKEMAPLDRDGLRAKIIRERLGELK